ncbi:unnamed protein product, partial [Prunus brigantina]
GSTSGEHLKDRDTTQTNLTFLASFARQGRMFLNLPLSEPEIHEEFFKGLNITTGHKKNYSQQAFQTYYGAAAELLQSEHPVRVMWLSLRYHYAKWGMKMPNSLMLKESSVMKMSLHMRNNENLMNNCTAMSHCQMDHIVW